MVVVGYLGLHQSWGPHAIFTKMSSWAVMWRACISKIFTQVIPRKRKLSNKQLKMNPKQKVEQKSKEENVDETASECVAAELMSVPQCLHVTTSKWRSCLRPA